MTLAMARLLFFSFAILFLGNGSSLICFDNISAMRPIYIGCNFPDAACGYTTRSYIGMTNVTFEVRKYFCAHKESTCKTGPGNACAEVLEEVFTSLKLKKVNKCKTECCTTNKCNSGKEVNSDSLIIGLLNTDNNPKDFVGPPLKCFQTIGVRAEKVECLFEDAVCVYHAKQVSYDDWKGESLNKGFQLCGVRSECDVQKSSLCTGEGEDGDCSYDCCDSNFCNALPDSSHYVKNDEGRPPPLRKPSSNFAQQTGTWESVLAAARPPVKANSYRRRQRKIRRKLMRRRRPKTERSPSDASLTTTKTNQTIGTATSTTAATNITTSQTNNLEDPTSIFQTSATISKFRKSSRPLLDTGSLTAIAIMVSLTFVTVLVGVWIYCKRKYESASPPRQSERPSPEGQAETTVHEEAKSSTH